MPRKTQAAKVSARQAVAEVLKGRRNGMHAADIVAALLDRPDVQLKGATPAQTISAVLSIEAKKADGRWVRVAPATYKLRPRR